MSFHFTRRLAAAVAIPLLAASAVPSAAQIARPLSGDVPSVGEAVTPVYWRGRGVAIGAGIATGLLLGGVLAGRPYYWGYGAPYYAPPPVYVAPPVDPEAVAYCARRFKSYDPASGTYLGYDGYRHPCP